MQLSMNVQKHFATFTLTADLAVNGDRVGIFGPSGSGKSTLVSMLAGLVKPDSGEIVLDGNILFSSGKGINCRPDKRRIAMVFQHHGLFAHLNVKDNLFYGLKRSAQEHRRIGFDDLIEILEIGNLLDRKVDHLSGGEKQRVAIGRAVLASPRLLLMDEPLSALDDNLRFQIIPYLKSVSEQFGIPYLFISHSLVEMRLMATEVVSMADGRVAAVTTAEALARSRMELSTAGYVNLLRLGRPETANGLFAYPWGRTRLLLSAGTDRDVSLAELSSKDIMLFKKHPEAISARNLLPCRVEALFRAGRKVGVELDCAGDTLIAEVVEEAVTELAISPGSRLYAAIKASAFRILPG